MTGRTLAHYEILEKLGEGGMGVVYKARDPRLNRFVAIKLLPAEKLGDDDRLRRFTQEARTASSLNHPNIITIHDISSEAGAPFIVMEHVAGKTLDQIIPKKGMRTGEVLKLAVQIANGLAAAAAAGVTHRDIKPSNIMVSDAGHVKVLDFGLAKAPDAAPKPDASAATVAMSAPDAQPRTREGTVMGTACYMSPEQAEGKHVDTRSDIFSFGAVLYEMITGQRAFRGDTAMSTISSILRDDPEPLSRLTSDVPRDLEKVVARCLRKDPERRFQNMADVKVALLELKEESESGKLPTAPVQAAKKSFLWPAVAAIAVVLAGAAYVATRGKQAPPADAEMRVVPFSSYRGFQTTPTFSPDGSQVAFAWYGDHGDIPHIYAKVIGTESPLQLTSGPDADVQPAWAPDGRSIFFLRRRATGVSIYQVSPLGGKERLVASPEGSDVFRGGLSIASDGKWLLCTGKERAEEATVSALAVSPETGAIRRLKLDASRTWFSPVLSPDRRQLLLARSLPDTNTELLVAAVDDRLEVQGEPRLLKTPRGVSRPNAWSADSKDALFTYSPTVESGGRLMRMPADGSAPPRVVPTGAEGITSARVSARGDRLAFSRTFGDNNVWAVTVTGPGRANAPEVAIQSARSEWVRPNSWSPDSRRVAFESDRSAVRTVWIANADGSQASMLVPGGEYTTGSPAWSPDGKWIAFDTRKDGNPEVYVISADGGPARRLTNHPSMDAVPAWSRDSKSVYFVSDRTKRFEIFKVSAEGGEATQLTRNGGWGAQESSDGKWLYYARSRGPSGPSVGALPKFPLLRMPVEGGEEMQVLDGVVERSWAVAAEGVWYLWAERNQKAELRFFDFKSGKSNTAAIITKPMATGLARSPDGRTLLYNQVDQQATEILLIENFK